MFEKARWIGIPESEKKKWNIIEGKMKNRFAYFYLDFYILKKGKLNLLISAVARYRMWINGNSVLSGPCKGDRYRQYYDEIDASKYLVEGKNRIAVQVLALDSYIENNLMQEGEQPILAYAGLPLGHRLAVEGAVVSSEENVIVDLTTGQADWRVYLEGSYQLQYQKPYLTWLGAIAEVIPENAVPFRWKEITTENREFVEAKIMETVKVDDGNNACGNIGVLPIKQREIPLLYERYGSFFKELSSQFLKEIYHIPADTKCQFILDAGTLKTAFVKFPFEKGKGAKIVFTYAERFFSHNDELPRDDIRGWIEGMRDEIILDGSAFIYEPFWYRTFRFIKIEICTGKEEMVLHKPYFMETGYPIKIKANIESEQNWIKDVWNICVSTVERCMNETYMDCPYYEQMQFPMDTRLQALYTYILGNETRLAKKALKDFHYSMTPEGLIQGKYPCSHTQIISTFSLHYIFMLREYYMQTGDTEILKRYRTDVDMILEYYDRKIKDGLVENLGYWEFVDWQEKWGANNGAPEATVKGPSTIINLMYGYGLLCGAWINEITGRIETAEEYRKRQELICREIEKKCWSEEKKLFREGPELEQYTIHAQAWAVLNGMRKGDAYAIMKRALWEKDVLQCSFSTSFEVFEALYRCGGYHLAEDMFELWKELPGKGCTTCPEVPKNSRSECHAWSAQPIYELIYHVLGISMEDAGWKKIEIRPEMEFIPDLKGEFPTPMGMFKFDLKKDKSLFRAKLWIPGGIQADFYYKESKRHLLPGENVVEIYQEG